jgi:phosphoglycerol transferase MdoB-like AlkP superfamily enzyme
MVKDDERIGSHKDIFPTLYNLALSDVEYLNMGDNLLAKHRRGLIFGYNPQLILLKDGVIKGHGAEALFYPFRNSKRYFVKAGQPLTAEQALILKRVAAYETLLDWQIQRQGYDGLHHKKLN